MDPRERYEDVVALYYDRIKRYLALKVDLQTAEDLTQLTFIKAYENYHAFQNRSTLFTWLSSIARNNLKNEYRKKHRAHESIDDIGRQHHFVSFEFMTNVELRIDMTTALQSIQPLDREIIALHYDAGFTLPEISEIIGLKLSAVKNRLYRALKKLKHQFNVDNELHGGLSAARFVQLISAGRMAGESSSQQQQQMYQHILDHLTRKVGQIFELLRYKPSGKITIEIYEDLQAFHQAVHEPDAPDWFMGMIEGSTIKIASPLQPGPEHTYESILKSVVHLFTMYVVKEINPDTPKWLYQGLGGYQAELMTEPYIRDSIAQQVESGEIPGLEDLNDNSWAFETKKGFQFSYTLAAFLLKQYGASALNRFIRSPINFKEAFGCSEASFHRSWKEWLAVFMEQLRRG